MPGILKLFKYRKFDEAIEGFSAGEVSVLIDSPSRNYITSLILYDGEIVDFITTDNAVEGRVRLNFTIPERFDSSKISIFSFSHADGYTNRLIGSQYWGVWFQSLGLITSLGKDYTKDGAVLLIVPLVSSNMKLKFTRLNNSTAGHGELT